MNEAVSRLQILAFQVATIGMIAACTLVLRADYGPVSGLLTDGILAVVTAAGTLGAAYLHWGWSG